MRLLKSLMAASVAVFMSVPAGTAIAAPNYDWTGFYIGGVASGGLFTVEQEDYWCNSACNAPTLQDWGASIGIQAGHNWQKGNFVYGIVADWSTGFEDDIEVVWSSENSVARFSGEWNSYATIRGRAGLATGDALIFATGGIAIVSTDFFGGNDSDFDDNDFVCSDSGVDCASHSGTEIGFAGGVGVAMPVGDKMHMTFEYLYIGVPTQEDLYDFDESGDDTDDIVAWTTSTQLARIALVWEFD